MDWIQVAQYRAQCRALLNTVMNLLVPQKAGNLLTNWSTISFSRKTLLHGVRWVLNGKMTADVQGAAAAYHKVMYQHLSEGTKENH